MVSVRGRSRRWKSRSPTRHPGQGSGPAPQAHEVIGGGPSPADYASLCWLCSGVGKPRAAGSTYRSSLTPSGRFRERAHTRRGSRAGCPERGSARLGQGHTTSARRWPRWCAARDRTPNPLILVAELVRTVRRLSHLNSDKAICTTTAFVLSRCLAYFRAERCGMKCGRFGSRANSFARVLPLEHRTKSDVL